MEVLTFLFYPFLGCVLLILIGLRYPDAPENLASAIVD